MLWRIAAFAALGGFLFGYDLGVMGGALIGISKEFATSDWMDGLIVGAAKFGACFGAFLGGALMLHYGRRLAITIDSLLFMAAPVIMASSRGPMGLVVGRLVVGLGIGVSAVVVPTYLGEVAPPKSRGTIVEIYEVLLCVGMLVALIVDWLLADLPGAWRWMLGMPLLPALIMSAALFVIPESPRWLVVSGRLDEALVVLHRTLAAVLPHGSQGHTAEAEQELLELWSGVEKDKAALVNRFKQRQRQPSAGRLAMIAKAVGDRKHNWHSVSSSDAGQLDRRGVMSLQSLRRTPHRAKPSCDRTPPQLPLREAVSCGLPTGSLPTLSESSDRRSGSSTVAASASPSVDGGTAVEGQRLIPTAAIAAAHSSSRISDRPPRHQGGSMHRVGVLRGCASGPALDQMQSFGSPNSPAEQPGAEVPLCNPSLCPRATARTTYGEAPLVSQPRTPLQSRRTAEAADGGINAADGTAAQPELPPPRGLRPRKRWQDYGEGSDSSNCETPPQSSNADDHKHGLLAQHDGSATQAAIDFCDNMCSDSASHISHVTPSPSKQQPRRQLTVRTECSGNGGSGASSGCISPVLWFDGEGTPQFHQSLSRVPAGLTPIRTRSEDYEADLAADSRALAVLHKVAARQGQTRPSRDCKPLRRHSDIGPIGEASATYVAPISLPKSPSFASTLVAMLIDIGCVARGEERGAFWVAICLAFFNQACASTAIINYAPELLSEAGGLHDADSIFYSSFVSASKVVGVVAAMLLIDRVGRRPLLLVGSAVSAAAMTALAMSDAVHSSALILAAMCAFIVAFSASWAGVFWVLMSEIFSMSVKSPALSAAVAALFLAGAVTDFLFLALHHIFGGGTFLLFAAVSAAGGIFVHRNLPETRGKNLEEVQALMSALYLRRRIERSESQTEMQLTRLRADIP